MMQENRKFYADGYTAISNLADEGIAEELRDSSVFIYFDQWYISITSEGNFHCIFGNEEILTTNLEEAELWLWEIIKDEVKHEIT